jgi:aryl-alcohol dehydrogenase-like predicted oxidoreductase
VVTKFGMYPKPTGILQDYTPKATLKSVQCSLRNLQGQRVDVWLAHSPPLSDPKVRRSLSQSFSLLRDNGISGDFGISLGRISDLEWVNHFEGVSFAQINLSLMDQRLLEEKNLEIIRSSCIAVMARTVFNYGYLTSVPPETTNLRPGFHIRRFPLQMREIWLEEHWVWLQVARELELPLEHLAVLFVRSQPIVSCATLGIMSVSDLVSAKLSMNYALLDDEALFLIRETFSGLEARRLRAGVLSIAN